MPFDAGQNEGLICLQLRNSIYHLRPNQKQSNYYNNMSSDLSDQTKELKGPVEGHL
jgi:hypothetical protein